MWLNVYRVMLFVAIWVPVVYAADGENRKFVFDYRVSIGEVSGHAKLWIPVPQDTAHQDIAGLNVETNTEYTYVTDSDYGNRFVLVEREGGGIDIAINFTVTRERRTAGDVGNSVTLSSEERARYLGASRLVVIDGVVHKEAHRIAGGAKTTYAKARSLYDHIVDTVRYDKSGKGWGRGDAVYACHTRAGNCTDFHSLFIGEARSLGVPSRFLMGFSVPNDKPSGTISGYHCWAEFYKDGTGWLPLDASEAFKNQRRRDELFGGLDANRVQITVGRDITLPGMAGEPLNFAIYPYVEVEGKVSDAATYSFEYRSR